MLSLASRFYPQIITLSIALMVVCRGISELLWVIARMTPNTDDDKIAAGFASLTETLAKMFGNLGVGLPKAQVESRTKTIQKV